MPPASTWLSTSLLPVSATPLGRLVADIMDPEADFEDTSFSSERPEGPKAKATEVQKRPFLQDAATARSGTIALAVTSALSSTFSVDMGEITRIEADNCTRWRLSNSAAYFELACRSDSVRAWLEQRWRRNRRAYMVVGVMTLLNSSITLRSAKDFILGQKVGVSGSLVLQAATHGLVATLGGIESVLDSEVEGSLAGKKATASSFTVPGESVLAVLYQQVDFSWFRNPSSKPVMLKAGAKWEAYLGARGEDSDAGSGNEDVADEDTGGDFGTLYVDLYSGVASDGLSELDGYEEFVLSDNEA